MTVRIARTLRCTCTATNAFEEWYLTDRMVFVREPGADGLGVVHVLPGNE